MDIPKRIKCALCGTDFEVKKPLTGRGMFVAGEITSCKEVRPDGSICGRVYQHAEVDSYRIEMRVHPDDIRQIWRDSMGLD